MIEMLSRESAHYTWGTDFYSIYFPVSLRTIVQPFSEIWEVNVSNFISISCSSTKKKSIKGRCSGTHVWHLCLQSLEFPISKDNRKGNQVHAYYE